MKTFAWISVLAGIWLILSPFVLGFSNLTSGLWNNIVVGAVVIILGLILTGCKKPEPLV